MDLIVDLPGDQDTAGFGHGLETCGQVDALSKQVVAIDHDIAEMNSDTKTQAFAVASAGEFVLYLDGALNGLDHGRKLRDHPVTGCVGYPALMPLDEPGEDLARLLEFLERSDLVGIHGRAVPGRVGSHDRRQLPPDPGSTFGHRPTPLS